MPSKTSKRARRATQPTNTPNAKDDGTRWIVVRHGEPVYPSHKGTSRAEAERLAEGLQEPAEIIRLGILAYA